MSEKKMISRNVAIALGIVAIILLVGLVGAIANYTSIISGKDNTITTKDSQIQALTDQKNQLQTGLYGNQNRTNQIQAWLDGNITYCNSQINSKNSQITSLQNQITSLQNQMDNLKASKLIEVDLKAEDNRPWLQTPYLQVYGHVCNVGTDTAYGAILYVEAFQGSVLAFNTTISLGIINGESYTSVDSEIYYSGSELTMWHVWSKPIGINTYWFGG